MSLLPRSTDVAACGARDCALSKYALPSDWYVLTGPPKTTLVIPQTEEAHKRLRTEIGVSISNPSFDSK